MSWRPEGIALTRVAGVEGTLEPSRALLRRAVGEFLWHDVAGAEFLQTVSPIADRGGDAECAEKRDDNEGADSE
jgi:hypothetical protein